MLPSDLAIAPAKVRIDSTAQGCSYSPLTVRMVPELSAAALKSNHDKELALWYELRAINVTGTGRLIQDEAVAALVKRFGYSKRTAYRLLRTGDGRLWDIKRLPLSRFTSRDATNRDDRSRPFRQLKRFSKRRTYYRTKILGCIIDLYSLFKVAKYLDTSSLSGFIDISAESFRGRKAKRAWLYASFFKPDGARANPISRQSIEAATGIRRRQQRRYEIIAGINRVANFAFEQRGNGKLVPILQIVYGKVRQYVMVMRLGNTYHSQVSWPHRGMIKKVNAQLRQRSLERVEARLSRRFFFKAQSVIKTPHRDLESFLLVGKWDRLIRGRMEWCQV